MIYRHLCSSVPLRQTIISSCRRNATQFQLRIRCGLDYSEPLLSFYLVGIGVGEK